MKTLLGPAVRARAGFSYFEMVLLILVMLAFLAGVVLLTGRAVSDSGPGSSHSEISRESEDVFDSLGALLGSASSFSLYQRGSQPPENVTRLAFEADLDGSGDMESVLVRRSASDARVLLAEVRDGTRLYRIELSSRLDGRATDPFLVSYESGGETIPGSRMARAADEGVGISSVRVRLTLRSGVDSRSFVRGFEFDESLPVAGR